MATGERHASSESSGLLATIQQLGEIGPELTIAQARLLIRAMTGLFSAAMLTAGHDKRQITRLTTKFRDSGRRSPPWKPTSSRVPGRPQDGADGNRISRWLLEEAHKFYADEVTATLVEVKYYLQALSMDGAPQLPRNSIQHRFDWLVEQPVAPGNYVDPIQLIPIDLHTVVENARLIQSGHFVPLNRGGRHEPRNAFLMLARSNQLQGDLTVDELLSLMEAILTRHGRIRT